MSHEPTRDCLPCTSKHSSAQKGDALNQRWPVWPRQAVNVFYLRVCSGRALDRTLHRNYADIV